MHSDSVPAGHGTHTHSQNAWEAKAGGSRVQSLLATQGEVVFQKHTRAGGVVPPFRAWTATTIVAVLDSVPGTHIK